MTQAVIRHRPVWVDALLLGIAAVLFVCMVLLGNWQVARLGWKLDLIEQVEARAFTAPVEVTLPEVLPEYQRVTITGAYDHAASLRIKAVTELGPGHWVLTPLSVAEGQIWINRGFVPTGGDVTMTAPEGLQRLTGLIRYGTTGGTLLEENDPQTGRWVSFDLAAMSQATEQQATERFYIAADHNGAPQDWPRGGLTKLEFRNTHLSYALTWYAMASLFLGAMAFVVWDRFKPTFRDIWLSDQRS